MYIFVDSHIMSEIMIWFIVPLKFLPLEKHFFDKKVHAGVDIYRTWILAYKT